MFSNTSVKRLLQFRKGNGFEGSGIEAAWSEKAVRSLVKKLKNNSSHQIDNLVVALQSCNSKTPCVCIPR